MITREELIEIGVYNKPHGVNGEISATIDCDLDVLTRFSCLISDIDGIYVPFFVNASRGKTAQTALLLIDGISNENEAALLVNKAIFVKKNEFEDLAEAYDSDEMPIDYFIGYKAIINGKEAGEIVDVDDSTANVLFRIAAEDSDKEILVPAVDEFVVDIDTEGESIALDVPEELLNL
ncbi:MAG: ribosome maturation factor RimM [Bacteroidales bacterium]|nr:ribosome maturation factor RimM [Bacteroidales bacterium]